MSASSQAAPDAARQLAELPARVLEAFSDAIIVADAGNRIVFASAAVRPLLGHDPADLVGRPLLTVIPERFRARHLAGFHRFLRTGRSSIVGPAIRVPALRRDGTEVDVDLTLGALSLDGARLVVGSLRDAGPRVELEREAELTRELVRVLARATTLGQATGRIIEALCRVGDWQAGSIWTLDESAGELRCLDFWHDPGFDLSVFESATREAALPPGIGLPGRVWAAEQPAWVPDIRSDENFPRLQAALQVGIRSAFAFPVRHHDRLLAVIEVFARNPRPRDERVLRSAGEIANELGHFILRTRLEGDVEETNLRLRFLADASRILSSSLDHRDTLQRIARMAVPVLGDWCSLDLLGAAGLELVAAAHADPEKERTLQLLRRRYPPRPEQLPWVLSVVRTGSPMLHPRIDDALVAASAVDKEEGRLLADIGLRSALVVPLVAKGHVLGTLAVGRGPSRPSCDERDLALAEDLARRIALAIENARLYEKQKYVAETLQRALLPARLPDIPGVTMAATYRPAGRGNEIGGDLYDAFSVPDGWGVLVGDVSGKGIHAAAVTSMVRSAVRAAAMLGGTPRDVLQRTSLVLGDELPEGRYCTAALAFLELVGGGPRVTVACAGHPLPLVVRGDGTVERVGVHGQPLGLLPEPAIDDRPVLLGPGDLLLFYTDGLSDCWEDERELERSAASAAGCSARELVARVEADALEAVSGNHRDDIAVLALGVLRAEDGAGSSPRV